jgi:haloacetate dehalogenase
VRGWAVPTGHYPAEHRPDLIYKTFWAFFSGGEPQAVPDDPAAA